MFPIFEKIENNNNKQKQEGILIRNFIDDYDDDERVLVDKNSQSNFMHDRSNERVMYTYNVDIYSCFYMQT